MSMAQILHKRPGNLMNSTEVPCSKKKMNGIKKPHPRDSLEKIASDQGLDLTDRKFAEYMDSVDPLRHLRDDFCYPKMKDLQKTDLSLVDPEEDCVYFCGNSLGLCPKKFREYTLVEVNKWEKTGVEGHTSGDLPWAWCDEYFCEDMGKIVGAKKEEIAVMNGLTVNLHLQLISFYRPTPTRYKILMESKAFPSDHYAVESQIELHGYDPKTAMILIEPREGELVIRTEDILSKIEEEGNSIAVICLSGTQYYTGQVFDIPTITEAGQRKGCYVGWDLAHAAGNVELKLHDWNVDFACWCTYKYLNSGAGSLAGFFLHEKHKDNDFPKLKGWWGHNLHSRFMMDNNWCPYSGALQYRISNTPGFLAPSIKASLEIFNKTSMQELRAKSLLLTAYLEALITLKYGQQSKIPSQNGVQNGALLQNGQNRTLHMNDQNVEDWKHVHVDIITPSDPSQRGAQLSLSFSVPVAHVFEELTKRGVVCDERKPNVIRIAPAPLYCSFLDVYRGMKYLDESIQAAAKYS
ncbi:kynureninase-like [Saccostrea echinata]|uniref:kynureninase-like n=1 Tax=Saccostrea echinata TaxID=191078 RepID=UPI002A80C4A6|nr:kynureninase-like [Saccostrea echinata]XP_061181568.1 kynureninase-like [Saccostrea echinata]